MQQRQQQKQQRQTMTIYWYNTDNRVIELYCYKRARANLSDKSSNTEIHYRKRNARKVIIF